MIGWYHETDSLISVYYDVSMHVGWVLSCDPDEVWSTWRTCTVKLFGVYYLVAMGMGWTM